MPVTRTLSLPPRAPEPKPPSVPLAAVTAPILMAGALWFMTRSPVSLVFAAAGPLVAVVSLLEARRAAKRERRSAIAERAASVARLREQLAATHDEERMARALAAPDAAAALAAPDRPVLWQGAPAPLVRLGVGTVRSDAAVAGEPCDEAEAALRQAAGRLEDAPVAADASQGIAVCGDRVLALAFARGVVVKLAAALPPSRLALTAPAGEWSWVHELPHAVAPDQEVEQGRLLLAVADAERVALPAVAVYPSTADVPPGFATVVDMTGVGCASIVAATAEGLLEPLVEPELVSREDAAVFAARLAQRADRLGSSPRMPPERVEFAALPVATGGALPATLGVTAAGPFTIDLVEHGPHAIVAGVTGSGKSELLVTWVAALAAGRSTDEVNVLLVDFKGGTAFAPLAALPHVVGVITDLSGAEADRALRSLAAELRRREAVLAALGVRDIRDDGGALPRLVIVVDEFAALMDAHDEFAGLFTDIAARGRALGVHLILCTQRPAGVMRDALVANCPLRLSLRVQSAADSRWVIGTDAAAGLRAAQKGRCIVSHDGALATVQVAITSPADLEAIAARSAGAAPVRRPWLDPLPSRLADLGGFDGPGVIGLADVPDEQRREAVRFEASVAPLLVVGAAGSGKTSLLAAIAERFEGEVVAAGADRERAWDALALAAGRCDAPAGETLLALDDVDALMARYSDEHALAFAERLGRVLRDGGPAGVRVVVSVQRVPPALRSPLGLARETVLLRHASKQDFVMASGSPELFDERMPPGGGVWRGRRVQFVATDAALPESPAVLHRPDLAGAAVVARAPARAARELRERGLDVVDLAGVGVPADLERLTGPVVADPDTWLAQWPLLSALRQRRPIVFVGCELADLRTVARIRGAVPPPLAAVAGRCWVATPDGELLRGSL